MSTKAPRWIVLSEAADMIGLSHVRLRQLCQEGRIGQKIGNQWAVTESELRRFAKIPREWGGRRKKGESTIDASHRRR